MHAAAPGTTLGTLQDYLARLYELDVAFRVEDFLLTDARVAQALEGASYRPLPEKLLLRESPAALELSVYLDPEVLQRLAAGGSLEDFWTVLEGVSHFLYLAWNAQHDRGVRAVELELQAEVDKYALTTLIGAGQAGLGAGDVHQLLFECAHFDSGLSGALLERYRDATRDAARYCLSLARRFAGPKDPARLRELRRFYRLDHCTKIRFIAEH
ncbi:MAG TPA: hypothetical protein VJR90_01875 [Gammaproteobacteria bacterium]|nr:hypothetical protein [Gammaproteobacteria bacterium]